MSKHTTNEPTNEIEPGFCHCGCGGRTRISPKSSKRDGWIKGEPRDYILNHHTRISIHPNLEKLCECGCGQLAPVAQRTNSTLGHVKGQPMRFVLGHHNKVRKLTAAEPRFWAKVNKNGPNGCWDWFGAHDKFGYGTIYVGKDAPQSRMKAHRFSWELHNGPIPEGIEVCHNCPGGTDRPCCVNPEHLFLGTHKENMHDSISKGRAVMPPPNQVRGETNGLATFTDAQVIALREEFAASDMKIAPFARKHGVPMTTMWRIIRRKNWTHLP